MLPTLQKQLQAATATRLNSARRSIRGVVAAANLTGHQTATGAMHNVEIKSADTGNTAAGSIAAPAASINFKNYESNGLATCHGRINNKDAEFDSWATPAKLKKFEIFSSVPEPDQAGPNRLPAIGIGNSVANTCTPNCAEAVQVTMAGNNICVAGGKNFKTTATELDATADADYSFNKLGTYDHTNQDHYLKQAAIDITAAATTLGAAASRFNPDDLNSFINDDDFIAAVGSIYANLPRDKETGEEKKYSIQPYHKQFW
ncbi:uncharacterized protein TEOVI_000768200 [Trypanosoma equiperdum]|uniref:Trypanosome variant surface glycoprotein (A-type) n=1 Tax=Trypanosoma equiperdum TaxID=5694 RepID=A0A1G4I030_TRYEQ|nr:hypothetical protein TEOVI_000768200 [Trypanosoma equiperdum]